MLNNEVTKIRRQAERVITELLEQSAPQAGDLIVVGCSTSEVAGNRIGSASSMDVALELYEAIAPAIASRQCFLAAQCCEHLNRALILEKEAADRYGYEPVWVVPKPKAGGSFATAAWQRMEQPVAVEHIRAACGLDIGGTLIGMHLKEVAVPVRLSIDRIGEARILCARTRPKYIGWIRACYE